MLNKSSLAFLLFMSSLTFSNIAFSQSDSTNLPGLSANMQSTPTTTSGTGVPNAGSADVSTTTTNTEMMVDTCPTTGGNGYGYYPNGPVPTDGSISNGDNIQGGVISERTVTTDRFGTTTYGAWTQVNFLCTAIPYPPGCPSGQTVTTTPYWDWGSDQWVGLTCSNPVVTAAAEGNACAQALGAVDPYSGNLIKTSPDQTLFGTLNGPYNGAGLSQYNNYIDNPYCGFAQVKSSGTPGTPAANNDLWYGTDGYGGVGYCWITPGTTTVSAILYELEAPNSCGGGPN
jgi:hypothetical protein